ncbi:MAG: MATE family efflux transporter [Pseudomonadota bacterium]|nr:MATE family efflux transporter [Pseudomonadota bacterium]
MADSPTRPGHTVDTEINKASDNPVLSGPHWPVFFRYAVPSVAGLLALTTANIVDGIFIGNFAGADALAALNLLIPWFTLLFGLGLALAIGGTVRAGKYLGEQRPDLASAVFSKCLITMFAVAMAGAIIGLLFHDTLYRLLGASPELFPRMSEYFLVIIWVLVLQLVTMVLYYFVRVDGFPVLATTALVVGAGANILLDALFVGLWGLGLRGAALATGLAQVLQLAVLAVYAFKPARTLSFRWRQRQWREVVKAFTNGVSECINEWSVGLIMLLINWLLMTSQGIDGVAAFTVVNYLIFLSLMIFYGISDAMHVLISQNLGAGNPHRIRQFMGCGALVIISLGAILVIVVWLQGGQLVRLFLDASDTATASLADRFLAILWPLFLINGINVLLSVYLTAMHKPLPSALVAFSRSLILPAVLLITIAQLAPEWPLLVALPLAEWLTFGLALALFLRYRPGRELPAPAPTAQT